MPETLKNLLCLAVVCGSCMLIPLLSLALLLYCRRLRLARRCPEKPKDTHEGREIREKQEQERELTKRRPEERLRTVKQLRPRLDELGRDGKVPLSVAERFIKMCTWWLSHSSGRPILASGHYRRIEGSEYDWRVKFGNNYFLVGKAIWRCRRKLVDFLDQAAEGYVMSHSELVEDLVLVVRGAVANGEGYEYRGYYPLGDGCHGHNKMVFGTQAIDVRAFVNLVLETVPVDALWGDS